MKDHPGDFNSKVGCDIYLNPWWGLRSAISQALILELTKQLGEPDLWFQGLFHELLWGPRDLPRVWRPGFCCNLSGTNGHVWRSFWLPWRFRTEEMITSKVPVGSNVTDEETHGEDVEFVPCYRVGIPAIRNWLKTGEIPTWRPERSLT